MPKSISANEATALMVGALDRRLEPVYDAICCAAQEGKGSANYYGNLNEKELERLHYLGFTLHELQDVDGDGYLIVWKDKVLFKEVKEF